MKISTFPGDLKLFNRGPDIDDTAANKLVLYNGTEEYDTGQENMRGDWQGKQDCPTDLVICGLQTRVEEKFQGDNTALNGVVLLCCVPITTGRFITFTVVYSHDLRMYFRIRQIKFHISLLWN